MNDDIPTSTNDLLKDEFGFTSTETDTKTEQGTEQNHKKSRENKTERIIKLVMDSRLKMFLDESGEVMVVLPEEPVAAYSTKSREFENWLRGLIYRELKNAFSDSVLKMVIGTIIGAAVNDNSKVKTHLRTAYVNDQLYYDLGDGKRLVIVNDSDWKIKDFSGQESPVYFHYSPLNKSQFTPERGGDIKKVLSLINVNDKKSKVIYLTTLVSWLFPHVPRPILLLIGPKGSAKSTSLKNIKMLVDPSKTPLISIPKDPHELAIFTAHQSVLGLDNMSKINDEFSDFLSMLITGGGYISKELYANDRLMVFDRRPAIGITSIISVVNKPDLLNRSIIVEHQEITQENRREEGEIQKAFEEAAPGILGGMFSIASKVIKLLPSIKLKRPPRMADYARLSAAAWLAMGGSVEEYEQVTEDNLANQNETVLENSTIGQAIINLVDKWNTDHEEQFSPTQLFSSLQTIVNPNNSKFISGFPSAVNKLRSYLIPIIQNLREVGIQITDGRSSSERWWKIKKTKVNNVRSNDDFFESSVIGNNPINRQNDDSDGNDNSFTSFDNEEEIEEAMDSGINKEGFEQQKLSQLSLGQIDGLKQSDDKLPDIVISPTENTPKIKVCPTCRGTNFWKRFDGVDVCSTCHPN